MTEEKDKIHFATIIEIISKVLPFGYVFLVFCGALYLEFYYNTFHIDIFRYLDLSEIAVSFLPIILTIFFNSAIFLLFIISSHFQKNHHPIFYPKYKFNSKWQNSLTMVICAICVLYLCVSYYRLEASSVKFPFYQGLLRIVIWWSFLILSLIVLFLIDNAHRVIVIITIFIMSVVHRSIGNVQEVIENPKTYSIITIQDSVITTSSKHYFVGSTNHYIFLYDSSTNICENIPLTQIKKISFTNE